MFLHRDTKEREYFEDVISATVAPNSSFLISKGGHYQVQCYKENIIGRGKKLDAQKSVTLYGAGIYSFVLVETGVITAQSLQVF